MVASNNDEENKDNCKDVKCSNDPCPSYTQRAGKSPIKVGDECCSCEESKELFTENEKFSIKQIAIHFAINLKQVGYYLLIILAIFAIIIHPLYNSCQDQNSSLLLDLLGLDLGNINSIRNFSIIDELEKLRKKSKTDKLERGLNPGLLIWIKNCIKWNITILIKWFFYTLDFITGNIKNNSSNEDNILGSTISSKTGGGKNDCLKYVSKFDTYILLIFPIILLFTLSNLWLTFAGLFSYLYLLFSILNKGYFPHALTKLNTPDYDSKTDNELSSINSTIQLLLDKLYTPNSVTNIFPIWSYFLSSCFYEGIGTEEIFKDIKPNINSNSYIREIIKFITIVKFSWSGMLSTDCNDNKSNFNPNNSDIVNSIKVFGKSIWRFISKIFTNPISFIALIFGFIITFIADFIVSPIPIPLPIGLGKTYNWGAISLGNYWSLFWIPVLTASFWIRVFNVPEVFRILLCWFLNIITFLFIIGPGIFIYMIFLFILFIVKWIMNIFNFTNLLQNLKFFRDNNSLFLSFIFSILILIAWGKSFTSVELKSPTIVLLMLSLPTAFLLSWLRKLF